MTLDVPPLPPPLPLRPRVDFGRRVRRHADPAGPACSGVHFRSVLRFASGFFPTRPRGASAGVSRRQGLRAVASSSRLLPPRPAKDFHLQSRAHARHTFGPRLRRLSALTRVRPSTNRATERSKGRSGPPARRPARQSPTEEPKPSALPDPKWPPKSARRPAWGSRQGHRPLALPQENETRRSGHLMCYQNRPT
jgi:hypothetical protein